MSRIPTERPAPRPTAAGTLGDALLLHYEDLVGYVRRRFSLGEFARDVVHDAFVQVTDRPPRAAARNPVGLLRRLLHNLAVDSLRRADARQRHEQALDADALPQAICPAPRPDQVLQGRQALERLSQAIAELPPRCREVFILHKIHGLPQAQVAAVLQVSLKTVEQHLRRGLRSCRVHLERDGHA